MKNPFKKQKTDPAFECFKEELDTFYDSFERYVITGNGCLTAKEHYRLLKAKGLTKKQILLNEEDKMVDILSSYCAQLMKLTINLGGIEELIKMGEDIFIGAMMSRITNDMKFIIFAIVDVFDFIFLSECEGCSKKSW